MGGLGGGEKRERGGECGDEMRGEEEGRVGEERRRLGMGEKAKLGRAMHGRVVALGFCIPTIDGIPVAYLFYARCKKKDVAD